MNALRAKAEVRPTSGAVRADSRHRSGVEHLRVGPENDAQRLDNFLQARLRSLPKALIYRIIRTGQVRVNGGRSGADQRLVAGDVVRLPPLSFAPGDAVRRSAVSAGNGLDHDEVPILFEDDALLALDKPAGLAVHGGSGIRSGLIERLRAGRGSSPFLELVHRLDRDTSGILLVAKERKTLIALHRQFALGQASKRYCAVVKGYWGREAPALLDFPLERYVAAAGERRVRVKDGGQSSATRVTLNRHLDSSGIAGFPPSLSLLDCHLLTGRTHQIRVHLGHTGFPILGDAKYGDFTLNKLLDKIGHKRLFLHALELEIGYPADGEKLRLTSPLPLAFADLEGALPALAQRR